MLEKRASQKQLAVLARQLGVSLYSGVAIVRAFELASRKGSGRLREVLEEITSQIKSGHDVTSALSAHGRFFPPLFIDMVQVGETAGALPEVLKSLATHYENNLRLRKEFVRQITIPVLQFVAAIFVIALLIFLLKWVADLGGGDAVDVLGWGLMGLPGVLVWLGGWTAAIVGGVLLYQVLSRSLTGKKMLHRVLLGWPVIGECLRSFAIARFSWAFHLTQEAGMPIEHSLDASLRATSNGAFVAAIPHVIADIEDGHTLTETLTRTGLFPQEYLEMVLVAETSGTVPEALERLSPQFEDDARRSLQGLTTALGWLIWVAVAAFIIYLIFTIALWYLNLITDILRDSPM